AVLISGLATGPSGSCGPGFSGNGYLAQCAAHTYRLRLNRFWLRELPVSRTFSGPQPFRPWATSRLQGAPGQTQDLVLGDLSRVDGGRVGHETRDHAIANQVELTGRLTRESGRDVNTALAEHRLHLGQRVRLLDLADEPGADVIAATVVEIARTLGCQQQTQPRGPRPAQQVLYRFLACGLPHRGEVLVGLIEHQDGLKRSIRGRSSTDPAPDFHHELCNPELHVLAAAEKLGADDAQPRLSRSCVAAESKQDLDLE